MKKIVLIVAAALLGTVTNVSAQDWSFGVKGGFNMANISNAGSEAKMKSSIYLGGFAKYRFNDIIGIQPELVYSRQGFRVKSGGAKEWLRMNYINIPVMAKIYVLENLSVDLGPQFGIMLNSKSKYKEGSTTVKSDIDGLRGGDVSLAMGLTYQINYRYDVSFRYNLGLTDVVKDGSDKNRNGVVQIGVGYRF